MRACVQRVSEASVTVEKEVISQIDGGFLVLVGVEKGDTERDTRYMADKLLGLRVFEDDDGKMNRSIVDAHGAMLIVSQFTLCGDVRKGRRPSFIDAAEPDEGERLYELLCDQIRSAGIEVQTGRFRTHMDVGLINDGPVTILIDSRKRW